MFKKFKEHELEVCALTVIAEDHGLEYGNVFLMDEECDGFNNELLGVLSEFDSVMSDIPGESSVAKMSIDIEHGTHVISQRPYHIPEDLQRDLSRKFISC